jgi:hypothetical protein
MAFFLVVDPEGIQHFFEMRRAPKSAIEVPRLPEAFEKWDVTIGDFIKDQAAETAERIVAIKAKATAEILAEYPFHKQLNDITDPSDAGAARIAWLAERRARINAQIETVEQKVI